MNRVLVVCVLATIAVASAMSPLEAKPFLREDQYQFLFTNWMTQHGKRYETSNLVDRYAIWKRNMNYIHRHNEQNASYTLAMNSFGDVTAEELSAQRNGFNYIHNPVMQRANSASGLLGAVHAPTSVDWRSQGAVLPVKNQGMCGSCWAFSAVGAIEGFRKLSPGGSLVALSEQELVDCADSRWGNQGCQGGLMDNAFEFIAYQNQGITSGAKYAYKGVQRACPATLPAAAAHLTGYVNVPPMNDAELVNAVAKGPVSVAIEADSEAFQFYSSGVFDDATCGTQLDHGVVAVGYGQDSRGVKYWIVRNSWGVEWGDQGYIKIVRGKNMCGINMAASYPTGVSI